MARSGTHPDYALNLPRWQRCRDLIDGEFRLKSSERRGTYLPPLPGHKRRPENYSLYVEGAVLYNATGRTFSGLRGLIERKEPDIQAPAAMQPFLDDCTGTGVSVAEMVALVTTEVLSVGRCGILTDFAAGEATGMTQREAERAGRRPYWTLYPAEAIVDWSTGKLPGAGSYGLTMVTLEEQFQDDSPRGERKTKVRRRVLEIDGSGVYRQRFLLRRERAGAPGPKSQTPSEAGADEEWVEDGTPLYPRRNGDLLHHLPFQFVNARSTTWQVGKPPLIDVADLNVAHYRNSAWYEHALLWVGNPTPWVTGYDPSREEAAEGGDGTPNPSGSNEWAIGGGAVWTFRAPDARVGLLSLKAEDVSALQDAMKAKEAQLVILGARILAPEKGVAESGRAKEIERTGENSALSTIAKMVSKGMTRAGEEALAWHGAEGKFSATANTDFFSEPLTPDEVRVMVEAWQQGVYALPDVRRLLRRGEWIDAERTDEDIDRDIEQEKPREPPADVLDAVREAARAARGDDPEEQE